MNDEHTDNTFRALQAELTVTPSPEFAAKVRARVAIEPVRRWFGVWQVATVTVAIASLAVAVVMWPRGSGSRDIARSRDIATAGQAPGAAASTIPRTSPIDDAPAPGASQPGQRRLPAAVRTAASRVPEVLVPSDQRIALAQLLVAMRDRGTQVPALVAGEIDVEGRLPAPAAISVAPITITPLGPPIPGGGSRERR
jgi:hypothetical protein